MINDVLVHVVVPSVMVLLIVISWPENDIMHNEKKNIIARMLYAPLWLVDGNSIKKNAKPNNTKNTVPSIILWYTTTY